MEQVQDMAWYFLFRESFRSSVVSLSLPMLEDGEWVKSSINCCTVSLFGNFFNLVKALVWLSARLQMNTRFLLLRVSLGSSRCCSCVMDALTPCLLMTLFTSAAEPSTRVFRVVLEPGGVGTFLPVPKQVSKIERANVETSSKATMSTAEEKTHYECVNCREEGGVKYSNHSSGCIRT